MHSCLVAKSASERLTTCKSALSNTHIHLDRMFRRTSRCGSCRAESLSVLSLDKLVSLFFISHPGPACLFDDRAYVRQRTKGGGTSVPSHVSGMSATDAVRGLGSLCAAAYGETA